MENKFDYSPIQWAISVNGKCISFTLVAEKDDLKKLFVFLDEVIHEITNVLHEIVQNMYTRSCFGFCHCRFELDFEYTMSGYHCLI